MGDVGDYLVIIVSIPNGVLTTEWTLQKVKWVVETIMMTALAR